ncbi:hypothetical protein F2Q69_00013537 [Brassica cretica]|uniref:Uncharacterized protein n=1 Tax=Brassica cretica TaxID=69181 RepID=A0A8S9QRF6_BRACR|nr:hypothetical protein F2Q69_00013537 [Brassica cretica]
MVKLSVLVPSGERASQLVILLRSLCCRQGRYLPRCNRSRNKIVSAWSVVLPGPKPKRSDDRGLLIPTHLKVLMLVVEECRHAVIELDDFMFLRSYFVAGNGNSTSSFLGDTTFRWVVPLPPTQVVIEMSSCRRLVGKKDRVGFELGIPVWISKVLDCYRYADSGCVIIM